MLYIFKRNKFRRLHMIETAILLISIILFVVALELLKRTALRNIKESHDADEACYYRKKFSKQRISIDIMFAIIASYTIFSGDNTGINSIMIGLLSAWISYVNKHSLPLSGKRPNDITKFKFILYLRGFAHDDYTLNQIDLTKKRNDLSNFSEGHFISILKQYMPVYTIGMTKELNSPIGAERIYLNDAEWEQEVINLMEKASLIVILLNDSQSCIWEICQSNQFKEKVVFISDNSVKLTNIRKELNKQYVYPFPIGLKDKTISYILEKKHQTLVIEYSNTEKNYRQIIKKLMHEKFGLRKFIFTQKRLKLILSIYGAIFLIGWSILSLKFHFGYTKAIIWGVLLYVVSAILMFFVYDKFYVILNYNKLK